MPTQTLSQILATAPAAPLTGGEIVELSQPDGQGGFNTVAALLSDVRTFVQRPASYTVATAPSAAGKAGLQIYVSDDIGGGTLAFSDDVNWLRVYDRTVISDV